MFKYYPKASFSCRRKGVFRTAYANPPVPISTYTPIRVWDGVLKSSLLRLGKSLQVEDFFMSLQSNQKNVFLFLYFFPSFFLLNIFFALFQECASFAISTQWIHNLNWTFLRRSYDVQDFIWTSYIYVQFKSCVHSVTQGPDFKIKI